MDDLIRRSVGEMEGYVPGEQPRSSQVVKLNTNENPYGPSSAVASVLTGFGDDELRRYPDPMCVELREVIAGLHGCGVENVFAGNGSDEILALCTRAFVENDGSVGFFDPSYSLYPVLADIRDVKSVRVVLGDGFEWVEPASDCCSLFMMTNPNAPIGMRYGVEVVEPFCKGFEGVVIVDEAYVDFSEGNCMELALRANNVLVMRTLSKSYSLAGIRVGYVVGCEKLISALYKIKDSYNLNAISQAVAVAALRDQKHMQSNVVRIKRTRERLRGELEKRGYQVLDSETNFLWAKPGSEAAQSVFGRLKENDVYVRYFPGGRTGDYIRITIGTDEEIDKLLACIR